MTSSRWHAHGNVYLVVEDGNYEFDEELDGAIEILRVDGDDVEIAIVNPDGSRAEMSGNGTRIAGAWLMARTGGEWARVCVSEQYESDLGPVTMHERERIAGFDVNAQNAIGLPAVPAAVTG